MSVGAADIEPSAKWVVYVVPGSDAGRYEYVTEPFLWSFFGITAC